MLAREPCADVLEQGYSGVLVLTDLTLLPGVKKVHLASDSTRKK